MPRRVKRLEAQDPTQQSRHGSVPLPRKASILAFRLNSQVTQPIIPGISVAMRNILPITLLRLASLHHRCTGRVPRSSVLLLLRASMVVVVLGAVISGHGPWSFEVKGNEIIPNIFRTTNKIHRVAQRGGPKRGSPPSRLCRILRTFVHSYPRALCPMTGCCSCVSGSWAEVMCPRTLVLASRIISGRGL